MSEDRPRYDDRVFLTGATGCGKSTVARAIFLSAAAPRVVIDPADSSATAVPGAVTVRGPAGRRMTDDDVEDAVLRALHGKAEVETLRFVPGLPGRQAEVEAAYSWAFDRFPRYLWLDEAGQAAPANLGPGAIRQLLTQGRKRSIGHLACHTRPVDVLVDLYAQAQHVGIWTLPHRDDRRRLAGSIGVSLDQLEDGLSRLEPIPGTTATGFLWFSQRTRTLTLCPPFGGS